MFATLHVLKGMFRICKRKDFIFTKILFMVLYLYMFILTVLSFMLVGTFYAPFSIFVRAVFSFDQ